MLRCFIVDDHPLFRAGLRRAIEGDPRITVVGEAGSAREARALMRDLRVDVALVDLALGDGSGLDLTQALAQELPGVRCLIISMHAEELYGERVLRAGARGFVSKTLGPAEVCAAIVRVGAGDLVLSDRLRDRLLARALSGERSPPSGAAGLSGRELEVLRQVGEGRSVHEIAQRLGISVKTVDTHRANLKKKLGATSLAALVRIAVQLFPNPEAPS